MIRGIFLLSLVATALGHGRLMDPPSRASQCTMAHQHENNEMGGKCGICGDPFDGPWPHRAPGGKYANGNIVAQYYQGSMVEVAVEVTTYHRGFFMFRLCPNNDIMQDPEQDCFDQHVLEMELEHGVGSQRFITSWDRGHWNSTIILPSDMTCSQCILQWTYTAGNDWGTCENGTQAVGCGPQEQFRACADIEIVAAHEFAKLSY